jgi:hypothetical protein
MVANTDARAASDAERYLRDAVVSGSIADFTALPAGHRQIRAALLQSLMSRQSAEVSLHGALRIRGAEITGDLRAQPGDGAQRQLALLFFACKFDGVVDLSGGDFLSLRFVDCELPAFIGASLSTKADLDLSGSCFSGVRDYESEMADVGACSIHLTNARIGGRLALSATAQSRFVTKGVVRLDGARIEGSVLMNGACLDGQGDAALDARSMTVTGNVYLGWSGAHRFEAIGEVALAAARITGDLSLRGARLTNPQGRALHCEDLRVETVFLSPAGDTPFEAEGRLNFLSATIGGSFLMTSARIAPGPDTGVLGGGGGAVALNLRQLRVSNTLTLVNIGALQPGGPPPSRSSVPIPVQGWFLLNNAHITGIQDSVETGWPAPGYLDIEGLTYDGLRSLNAGDIVRQRIAWLRLQYPDGQPTAATYRPQPYEELSRVLRRHGQAREADAVAVEKIRMRLAARVDGRLARWFPKLLMLVSHHGYSSSRAVLSFLLFVLLGTAMYATAVFGFGQPFVPYQTPPEPVEYVFAFDLLHASAERGCPGLDVLHYALDVALPVINLGQDDYCRFAPEGRWRGLWLLLHSLYALAGTALSAVVVLTLTGVLRRD